MQIDRVFPVVLVDVRYADARRLRGEFETLERGAVPPIGEQDEDVVRVRIDGNPGDRGDSAFIDGRRDGALGKGGIRVAVNERDVVAVASRVGELELLVVEREDRALDRKSVV